MRNTPIFLSLLALLTLLITGCATQYAVRVDALSDMRGGQAASYELTNENPGEEDTDLFFREISRHLHPVLREAGFDRAGEGREPAQLIGVKAYLSEPMVETRSQSEPIYTHTPGYNHVVRIPIVNEEGKVISYSYRSYWRPSRTQFAGYVDRDRQYTVYDKVLELSARERTPGGEAGEEVWTVRVALRSQSTDYRAALPYMLVAARPYLGKRTEGEEIILLKEDDPEVEAYRVEIANER